MAAQANRGVGKKDTVIHTATGTLHAAQQWSLSIKDTSLMRTLSAVPTTELCTNLPLNLVHLSIQDSQLGPNGVLYRAVPLYTVETFVVRTLKMSNCICRAESLPSRSMLVCSTGKASLRRHTALARTS